MKLLDVFLRPLTGDYVSAVLVLEHEGAKVEKVVRWVGLAAKVCRAGRRSELTHQVFRVIREAERDAAFILHGEAWRAHVGKFWRDASDEDRAFAREVADRVDRLMAPDCEKRQAFERLVAPSDVTDPPQGWSWAQVMLAGVWRGPLADHRHDVVVEQTTPTGHRSVELKGAGMDGGRFLAKQWNEEAKRGALS